MKKAEWEKLHLALYDAYWRRSIEGERPLIFL